MVALIIIAAAVALLAVDWLTGSDELRDADLARRHGPRLPSARERHGVAGGSLRQTWSPVPSGPPTG